MQNADFIKKKRNIIKHKNLLSRIKMDKENVNSLVKMKLKQINFTVIIIVLFKDVDFEKVLVSNKISFGGKNYKHFIVYLYSYDNCYPL